MNDVYSVAIWSRYKILFEGLFKIIFVVFVELGGLKDNLVAEKIE